MKMGGVLLCPEGGYGLVVECVLAKDEAGVRFSLSALLRSRNWSYAVHSTKKCDFKTTLQLCITWGILGIKDKGFLEKSVK